MMEKENIDDIISWLKIIVPCIFIFSVIHDWVYFSMFGLIFMNYPSTISDHFRTGLIWTPFILIIVLPIFMVVFLSEKNEGEGSGVNEEKQHEITYVFLILVAIATLFSSIFFYHYLNNDIEVFILSSSLTSFVAFSTMLIAKVFKKKIGIKFQIFHTSVLLFLFHVCIALGLALVIKKDKTPDFKLTTKTEEIVGSPIRYLDGVVIFWDSKKESSAIIPMKNIVSIRGI